MHFSWVRVPEAADCADATQIEADVERRLGWSPFGPGNGPRASIESLVTRRAGAWKAAMVMRRADGTELGTREVTSESGTCDSLAKAAGLAVAMMIEAAREDLGGAQPPTSLVVGEASPLAAASLASATSPKAGVPEGPVGEHSASGATLEVRVERHGSDHATAPVVAAPEAAWRPGFGLAAGVACADGVLPGVVCGPALNAAIHLHQRFAVSISVRMLPERSIERAGAVVGFDLTSAALGGCYAWLSVGAWSASTCASLLAGALHVTVLSPTPVGAGQRAWWAASLGLQAAWRAGMLEVHVGAEALTLLERHDYSVARVEPAVPESLFEQSPIGVMGTSGVGVRF